MTKDEALRLALEAFKEIIHWYAVRDRNDVLLNFVDQSPEIKKAMKAITAVEAALEAKDEPDKYAMDIECTKCGAKQSGVLTVHTNPPQRTWVGLTDEEILTYRYMIDWTADWSYIKFARAIEAAHGIKGEA